MNDLRNILKKYQFHPKSYERCNNVYIVDTDRGKYVVKNNTNNLSIYNYLSSRGFYNYPKSLNCENDNYDISTYIEEISLPKDQKIIDLLNILSVLHHKTSYHEEIDLDDIKEIYENTKKELFDLLKYYNSLNDLLDNDIFLSPSAYLLVRNISYIYKLINYSLSKIEYWYQIIKENKKRRVCLIHNNVSFEHLLINENKYLVSWDHSKIKSPIYDIVSFFKKYHYNLKLEDVIKIYENNNYLTNDEKVLLLVYLSIPMKIEFTSNNLEDVIKINDFILYTKKIYEYLKHNHEI